MVNSRPKSRATRARSEHLEQHPGIVDRVYCWPANPQGLLPGVQSLWTKVIFSPTPSGNKYLTISPNAPGFQWVPWGWPPGASRWLMHKLFTTVREQTNHTREFFSPLSSRDANSAEKNDYCWETLSFLCACDFLREESVHCVHLWYFKTMRLISVSLYLKSNILYSIN